MTRLQMPSQPMRATTRVRDYLALPRPPVVLAYGIGVDSTALLCGESISSYAGGGFVRR